MPVLFVCLSIAILLFILFYNSHVNSVAIASTLREHLAKSNQAGIESAEDFIQPVASTLRLFAEISGRADVLCPSIHGRNGPRTAFCRQKVGREISVSGGLTPYCCGFSTLLRNRFRGAVQSPLADGWRGGPPVNSVKGLVLGRIVEL
jgi:hypothetical protein